MSKYEELVDKTSHLLEEVERLRQEWDRSKELIESARQMRVAADGYINSLEEVNHSLGDCVNALLEEVDRLRKINEEFVRTAEVIAQISKDLD